MVKVRLLLGAALALAGCSASPSTGAPAVISSGQLSFPRSALLGWTVGAPNSQGTIVSKFDSAAPGREPQVDLGCLGPGQDTNRMPVEDAASLLSGFAMAKYAGRDAYRSGTKVTPSKVSGVQAAQAISKVDINQAPYGADELRVVLVDTSPRCYFISTVPIGDGARLRDVERASAGLAVTR